MLEEMQKIDTSVIDELMDVKHERETVSVRLKKMEGDHEKVSDVVFRRVKRDYESRVAALERKAAPLKERGRQEFAKLKALLDRLEAQHSATKFDREEVDFRHRLGEFEDPDFDKKITELEGKLEEQKSHLDDAGELRGRFVAAFDSEEELNAPPAAQAPPPPPAAAPAGAAGAPPVEAGITAPQPVPPPRFGSVSGSATPVVATTPGLPTLAPAAAPGAGESQNDGTMILPPEAPRPGGAPPAPGAPAAAPAGAKTAQMALGKLVPIDDDLGTSEFVLQPQSFVGRTPDNQIRINKPTVSRRHAQFVQGDKGWTLRDLRSENGTYVNGEKIQERVLVDGDRVHFGTVRVVFRVG